MQCRIAQDLATYQNQLERDERQYFEERDRAVDSYVDTLWASTKTFVEEAIDCGHLESFETFISTAHKVATGRADQHALEQALSNLITELGEQSDYQL